MSPRPHDLSGLDLRIADDVLVRDGGRLLVGGSPLIALRLSPTAAGLLATGRMTVTTPTGAVLAERLLATNMAVPMLEGHPVPASCDITVVIPVRDRAEQLDRALDALAPLNCLVVDDASADPSAVAAVAAARGADVVHLPVNLGPASARNAGLAKVSTPWVAFVDSDVTATPDALLSLAKHFADPKVALVGPRITGTVHTDHPRWFERYDAARSSLTLGRAPGSVRPGAAVGWLPSACLVGRVDALGSGFTEDLRVGEDVDLVWRLVAAGHRVRYEPTIAVGHDVRASVHAWLGRKAFYGSGGAGLAARHADALAPAVLGPSLAVGGLALLSARRWSLPVAVGTLAWSTTSVRRVLPETPGRTGLALRLATRGLVSSVRQEAALATRHWWPAALLGVLVSRPTRRVVVASFLVDSAIALAGRKADSLDIPTAIAGRRLDDLAYGAGLWWGAWRARSVKVLLPRRPQGQSWPSSNPMNNPSA